MICPQGLTPKCFESELCFPHYKIIQVLSAGNCWLLEPGLGTSKGLKDDPNDITSGSSHFWHQSRVSVQR